MADWRAKRIVAYRREGVYVIIGTLLSLFCCESAFYMPRLIHGYQPFLHHLAHWRLKEKFTLLGTATLLYY